MSGTHLVTGAAGFIGSFLARSLVEREGARVIGVDNLDGYYDPELKRARLDRLVGRRDFEFSRLDLRDDAAVRELFDGRDFDCVFHFAARPGVRASAEHPGATLDNNVAAFLPVLEACRREGVQHLVFASSSSVYGPVEPGVASEVGAETRPHSLYAATKKSAEAMARSYAHLHDVPTTGLRFFTVYGPWGRPDMAYSLFARAIADGETIQVHNHGEMERDFTYVEDVVEAVRRVANHPPKRGGPSVQGREASAGEEAPFRIFNVGRGAPVSLTRFIRTLEVAMGEEADKEFVDKPPGDVQRTHADVSRLEACIDYRPQTDIEEGLGSFVDWFRSHRL